MILVFEMIRNQQNKADKNVNTRRSIHFYAVIINNKQKIFNIYRNKDRIIIGKNIINVRPKINEMLMAANMYIILLMSISFE